MPALGHVASQLSLTHSYGITAVHRNISEFINLYSNHCPSSTLSVFTVIGPHMPNLHFLSQYDASAVSHPVRIGACRSQGLQWLGLCSLFMQGCINLGGTGIRYSAALDALSLPYIHVKNVIHMNFKPFRCPFNCF